MPKRSSSPKARGKPRPNVERGIADEIAAAIEAGTPPWRQPWTGGGGGLPLRATGEPYRGINVLVLWMAAAKKGHASPRWLTYRQAAEMGAQVRRGETGTTVVKYGTVEKEGRDGDGDGAREVRPYLRAHRVFNAAQVDGLPEGWDLAPPPADLGTRPDAAMEAYWARLGVPVETSPEPRAYYAPGRDVIHMPPVATFETAATYYETLAHEGCHATGAKHRLDRPIRCRDRAAYAFEELVAEIGQCILHAQLGLAPSIDQSAAYVATWLRALRDEHRAIFRAAAEAQRAVDWITAACGERVEPVDGEPAGSRDGAAASARTPEAVA